MTNSKPHPNVTGPGQGVYPEPENNERIHQCVPLPLPLAGPEMTSKEAPKLLCRMTIFSILVCLLIIPCLGYDTFVDADTYVGMCGSGGIIYFSGFNSSSTLYRFDFIPTHGSVDLDGSGGVITVKESTDNTVLGTCNCTLTGTDPNNGFSCIFDVDLSPLSGGHYVYINDAAKLGYTGEAKANPSDPPAYYHVTSPGNTNAFMGEHYTWYTAPPEYELNFTATSQFCYGSPVYFNLSELNEQVHGDYYLNMYHYSEYWNEIHQYSNGPLLYTTTLAPGGWSVCGSIIPDDCESGECVMSEWINFSVLYNCTLDYPITINPNTDMEAPTEWNWTIEEWPFNEPPPWDWDVEYGYNYAEYLYDNGYINETEYNQVMEVVTNIYNQYLNASTNATEALAYYEYGLLTPLIMVDNALNTTRLAVNNSISTISDSITPINNIFDWIFEMMPPIVKDLGAVILTLGLVKVILSWRKD